MKRRVIQIVVLLVLGAIVNVAVAWGCVVWAPDIQRYRLSGHAVEVLGYDAPNVWPAAVPSEWPITPHQTTIYTELGLTEISASGQDAPTFDFQVVLRAGLPFRSLFNERHKHNHGVWFHGAGFSYEAKAWHDGIPLNIPVAAKQEMRHFLPVRPIWPGFAINTIFHAAILWVLFFAPGKLRRTIRRRRGLCPACAYPIGTSPVCTECGKQLA
jgi:hypothetical protein